MSNVKIGDVVQGDHGVREVPAGTKLVRVGTTQIKTRNQHGGAWFLEGGSGWDGEWVIVGLAPEPEAPAKLDLTDKGVLALELYRQRTGDPERKDLPEYSATQWLAAAEFVLANFKVPSVRDAKVGDQVKVTGHEDHYYPTYLKGATGAVRETVDSDNELYVNFDVHGTHYVHVDALTLV